MLVDYLRVYQLDGQSIFVAEPPEISSDGRGGGGFSMVTAVSALVVLLVLFSLCIVSQESGVDRFYFRLGVGRSRPMTVLGTGSPSHIIPVCT